METQTKEDGEVFECVDIHYVDVRSFTKDENLRTVLHHLLNSLKITHGNELYVCKGKNGIIIKGWYFVADYLASCENVCLHIVKSECKDIDNPLDYCEKTCEKIITPYARVTLIENYSKLIYTLARHGFEFNARLDDTIFQIEIKQ
jgi:hypothetical protein